MMVKPMKAVRRSRSVTLCWAFVGAAMLILTHSLSTMFVTPQPPASSRLTVSPRRATEVTEAKTDVEPKPKIKIERIQTDLPEEEMSDLDKLLDKFNTRGGIIVATVLLLLAGYGVKAGFELAGADATTSGIWTSGIFFLGVCVWTVTYFTRVLTKSTTYVEQLRQYETQVILKRLSELDDDEIRALCAEVGVSDEELDQMYGDARQALSQKDQVLEMFKAVGPPRQNEDPRM
mmetsp:Transcript_12785/g.30012  ORF Transcript_12785/g.30012 Transcript_12785/m.30012 type:complete len:233 (-) Transcript_12785:68-766(-)